MRTDILLCSLQPGGSFVLAAGSSRTAQWQYLSWQQSWPRSARVGLPGGFTNTMGHEKQVLAEHPSERVLLGHLLFRPRFPSCEVIITHSPCRGVLAVGLLMPELLIEPSEMSIRMCTGAGNMWVHVVLGAGELGRQTEAVGTNLPLPSLNLEI